MRLKTLLLSSAFWTLTCSQCLAAEYLAPSCSYTDVNNTITAAAAGDIVYVPVGSATWGTTLAVAKSIKLIGAGIGQTVITCTGGTGITYTTNGDSTFELAGFTFIDDDQANGGFRPVNSSTVAPLYNLRVHHCKFQGWLYAFGGHETMGMVYGLIDNCQFSGNTYDFKFLADPREEESWTLFPGATNVGTVHYFYVEDCTTELATTIIISSGHGARWVYRHNVISNVPALHNDKLFDIHGDTGNRGVVAAELYENTMIGCDELQGVHFRGGTGIIFNNDFQPTGSSWQGRITVAEEYGDNVAPCDGTPGNCYSVTTGDGINNSYIWNNQNTLKVWELSLEESDCCVGEYPDFDLIAEDTDWWDDIGVGDVNFTTGLFAARPAGVEDDCYYATNTEVLYRYTGAAWTTIYSPYTYPHPLRGILNTPPKTRQVQVGTGPNSISVIAPGTPGSHQISINSN